jgi:hypothetical protein
LLILYPIHPSNGEGTLSLNDRIGLILHDRDDRSEELLTNFAFTLHESGVNIGGLVQRSVQIDNGKSVMDLIDIRTRHEFRISQNLGEGSNACTLDLAGLAEASQVLRREIDTGVDLLVINKFSGAEFTGSGLEAETFDAISRNIPILTSLARRYRAHWIELTDNAGTVISPTLADLHQWWNRLVSAKSDVQRIEP